MPPWRRSARTRARWTWIISAPSSRRRRTTRAAFWKRGREFFGFNGFTEAARKALPLGSLEAMGKAIVAAAKQFSGTKLHDDVCLLLIRMD